MKNNDDENVRLCLMDETVTPRIDESKFPICISVGNEFPSFFQNQN